MTVLPGAEHMLLTLQREVQIIVGNLGVMHRIFGRAKTRASIERKVELKGYRTNGRKLQDAIGIRVVVYFPEDCEVVQQAIENAFEVAGRSIDPLELSQFCPRRLNLVLRISRERWEIYDDGLPVDNTFEVQIRTVLSEGWHEVEHDLRYKCREDWNVAPGAERTLNGTLGALETTEWAMGTLFDELAYRHYRDANWEPMLRHKFRLRIQDDSHLSAPISDLLSRVPKVAKKIWKADRARLLCRIAESGATLPWTFDNLVFWIVAVEGITNEELRAMRPDYVAQIIDNATAMPAVCSEA